MHGADTDHHATPSPRPALPQSIPPFVLSWEQKTCFYVCTYRETTPPPKKKHARDTRKKGGTKTVKDKAAHNGGDEDARSSAVLSPSWLGAFTVSAYDEVVSVPFEVAALVDGKEVAAPSGARRGGGGGGDGGGADDGVVERRALGEDGRGEAPPPARTGEEGRDLRSKGRRRRRRRRRRSLGGLTSGAFGLDERDAEGGVAGEEEDWEEEEEEEEWGADQERKLDVGDDGCEVTVCAAAARIPSGYEGEGGVDDEPPPGEDELQSVCRSVVVKGMGAAVGGVLELPDRPQVTRVPNLVHHYRLGGCTSLSELANNCWLRCCDK